MKTENKQHELNTNEYQLLHEWLRSLNKVQEHRPDKITISDYASYVLSQNPTEWWTKYEKHLANTFKLSNGSYWTNNGKHQEFANKVEKLIPIRDAVMRSIPYSLSPKQSFKPLLECFRVYSNIYYDLYNNGGTNKYDRSEEYDCDYEEEYYEYSWRDTDTEEVVVTIDKYLGLTKYKSLKYNYEEEVKDYYDGGYSRSAANRYYIERVGDQLLEKLQAAYKSENAHLLERFKGVEV